MNNEDEQFICNKCHKKSLRWWCECWKCFNCGSWFIPATGERLETPDIKELEKI